MIKKLDFSISKKDFCHKTVKLGNSEKIHKKKNYLKKQKDAELKIKDVELKNK